MRVLFTSLPEYGHLHPMVPLARALVVAGHEVAFATAGDFCPRITQVGFASFPAGMNLQDQLEEARRRFPDEHALPSGEERFEEFVPRMLAGVAAPERVADLVATTRSWRPDLLVHGEADFAGPVAAEVAGIPYAGHSVGPLRPLSMARLAAEVLAPVHRDWGVDPGPWAGLFRYLYLDICPPSLQGPEPAIEVVHPLRPVAFDAAPGERLPSWVDDLPARPTVYVTFGTVAGAGAGAPFWVVVEALRDEEFNVVVTVGPDNDPAALGEQPAHVRLERYIPQSLLIPRCDLAVTHAGSSMLGVLACGVPLLALPRAANQFHNAAACVRAGAALRLLPGELTPAAVRRSVRQLVEERGFRDGARLVAAEIAAMPAPHEVIPSLERLVRTSRAAEAERPLPP